MDLPNDGSMFDPTIQPEEQAKEERLAIAKVEQSYPVLDELIEDREMRIKAADSISALGITSATPELQARIIIEGNTRYVDLLMAELENLRSMKEMILKD
jgi:hypothetical protein